MLQARDVLITSQTAFEAFVEQLSVDVRFQAVDNNVRTMLFEEVRAASQPQV